MRSDREWHFQIVRSSGLSADYTNHITSVLDPIHKRESSLKEAMKAIRERILRLPDYTEYARVSAQSSGNPSDFDVFVNDGNKKTVAHIDALVSELKAEIRKPLAQIDLALVCDKAEVIYSAVMGEAITFKLVRQSLASLIKKA